MRSGIYAWKLDGVYKYVGYGKDVEDRMLDRHLGNPYICEYDYDLFEKVIVRICEFKELRKWEAYYIKKFHTHVSYGGFNCNYGGGGCTEQTPEAKKKISDAMSGENHPWFGRHHSEKSKEKISNARIGTHHSEETKKKMSDMRKGVPKSEEHRKKIGAANKGRKHSEETKKNMSENHADFSGENNPSFGRKKNGCSSKYFGITKNIFKNKYIYYRIRITDNGEEIDLGEYKNEIEAAKIYDEYVVEHKLPNPLNFPEDYK